MKRRATRKKEGYEPQYRRFVRSFPCAAPGCHRRKGIQFCHERDKKTGLALKSPDARGWPGCPEHHKEYDRRRGFTLDWDNDARKAWLDPIVLDLRMQYRDAHGDEPELRQSIAGRRAA